MKTDYRFRPPRSEAEWEAYYGLRYRVLREPWSQPRGSERDEDESGYMHVAAFLDSSGTLIATGCTIPREPGILQVRYMAVDPQYRGQGIGRGLLVFLEARAIEAGVRRLLLNARGQAIGFYEACGYRVKEKAHLAFGTVQHYRMEKILAVPDAEAARSRLDR